MMTSRQESPRFREAVACARRTRGRFARSVAMACVIGLIGAAQAQAQAQAESELPARFRVFLAGNVGAHAADLGTTLSGLRVPGVREGNPAMGWSAEHPWAMGAVKAGAVGLSTWAKVETYRRGHTKLAWVWLLAETSLVTYVAIHNHRTQR